jgi:hypothetical protein
MSHADATERFLRLTEPLLIEPTITRSTMIGLPCVRVHGQFFASCDRSTGNLIVKLPEGEVDMLIASGAAESFAPAGRRFREWAAIPASQAHNWPQLLARAHAYVVSLPTTTHK